MAEESARRGTIERELEQLLRSLFEIVESLPPEDWDRQTGTADRWTIRDTVGHLVTGETGNLYIATTVAAGSDPARADFDLDRWNRRNIEKSAGKAPDELLRELREARAATIAFLSELSDGELDRSGHRTTGEDTTVEGVFLQIARHMREHTAEIRDALSAR